MSDMNDSRVRLRLTPPPPPSSRADCLNGPRPCRSTTCRHHLTQGEREPLPDAADSCSLDVADRGDHSLDAIGRQLGIGRERVHQIEERALERCRQKGVRLEHLIEVRSGWTHPSPIIDSLESFGAEDAAPASNVRLSCDQHSTVAAFDVMVATEVRRA